MACVTICPRSVERNQHATCHHSAERRRVAPDAGREIVQRTRRTPGKPPAATAPSTSAIDRTPVIVENGWRCGTTVGRRTY